MSNVNQPEPGKQPASSGSAPAGMQPPSSTRGVTPEHPSSLMHSIGAFFGHLARALNSDPVAGERIAKRTNVEQRSLTTAEADITLRRTVTDEVFVRPSGVAAAVRPPASGAKNPGPGNESKNPTI